MADSMIEARKRIAKAHEAGHAILDLSDLGLTALPPEIANLTELERIDLDNNQLSALPTEITSLTTLEHLWLPLE